MMLHHLHNHRAYSTSVAEGIEQGCGVRESGAVWIVVDCPYPGFISAAVLPRNVNGVADAAISQPARVTLVQTGLPGQVELADSSQLGSQGMAVGGGCGQAQPLRHGGMEDFT